MKKPVVVCLMGPTASGKTGLAVELVRNHNCSIISVDSALVYRGMDIGTAKPDAEMLKVAPHRLIDIIDPSESYSAADFLADVKGEVADVVSEGRTPLLVGGTMMYFNALKKGLAVMPQASQEVRQKIEEDARCRGWEGVHSDLAKIDPVSASRIHPNDPQRLQRALEVFLISGKTMTEFWAEQARQTLPFDMIDIAVMPQERSVLHGRIKERFDIMMREGFLDEVAMLRARGDLHIDLPSIRCVGYRQLWQYLDGQDSLIDAIDKGVIATRQLAKRQITWLRGWENLQVFDSLSKDLAGEALKYIESRII